MKMVRMPRIVEEKPSRTHIETATPVESATPIGSAPSSSHEMKE